MPLDLLLQRLGRRAAWREHYVSFDHLASLCIGYADHSGVGYRRVLEQTVLDLARADAIARAVDHIIGAAFVPVEAIRITAREIPGTAPATRELGPSRFGVSPILQEHDRVAFAPDGDLSNLASGHLVASLVQQRDAVARVGTPHGSWPGREQRCASADHIIHLGLPENLVDGYAKRIPGPLHDSLADGLTAAHQAAQVEPEAAARVGHLFHHRLERGGKEESIAHP